MTQPFSLANVESARRRLVSVDPNEVSLVDVPAILEPFSFLKNQDGGEGDGKADDEGKGEGDDKGAEDVASLVKDLFGGLVSEVEALTKSFADLKADKAEGDDGKSDEGKADEGDKADEATLVEKAAGAAASQVIAALTAQGVIKAPETAEDKFEKALTGFQEKSAEAFGKVEKAIGSLDERLTAFESQDGGSNQGADGGGDGGEDTDVTKNKDGDKNGKVDESTMFLSSLLASSLANPNQTQA